MAYEKGLYELGSGCYAYLQPDGSWGWSNAGLVVDGGATLLVDTLFDLPLTAEMLGVMRDAVPAARSIDVLVNTHANGDHCYGNELAGAEEILASEGCAEEFEEVPPALLAEMVKNADALGEPAAAFVRHAFGPFQFEGIHRHPTHRDLPRSDDPPGRRQARRDDRSRTGPHPR